MNISKIKRENIISKINEIRNKLKEENNDELSAVLYEIENELNSKRYGLVFEEHKEAIDELLETSEPIFVEDSSRAIIKNKTPNFLIEGDNLASLTLLKKTHKGKIDFIYIDPPYNTGKEDFIYNDRYVNSEDNFRHSQWLSFMDKRLRLAHQLLAKDGMIFISIDDNEFAQLKLLCDAVFGEENRLSIHHIQVRYANKSLNERKPFQECMEYVLIYAKDITKVDPNRPVQEYSLDSFKYKIKELVNPETIYIGDRKVEIFRKGEWEIEDVGAGIDNLKETWVTGSIYSGTGHGKMYQKVVEPRVEIDGYQCLYKVYGLGEDGLGYRYFTGPQKATATKGKMFTGVPLVKREEIESGNAVKLGVISNVYDFSPDFGNIRHEGGVGFNSGKKPTKMLKQFLNYHKKKDITVLDFFAGSCSTAHSVLSLNKEDGGTRKFIMCTSNEKNICEEVAYTRIKNILDDASLKYFKVDFVDKKDKLYYEYGDELLEHIRELVEIENGIVVDGKEIAIALDDDEFDEIIDNIEKLSLKKIYVGYDVMYSTAQQEKLAQNDIELFVIPDYYYKESGK